MLVWYSGGLVRRFSGMLLFVLFWWFGVLTRVVGGSGLPRVVWLARGFGGDLRLVLVVEFVFLGGWYFCWWIDLVPTCLGFVVFGGLV